MASARRFDRFNVQFEDMVSARLQSSPTHFHLMTIGAGGCSFVGNADISNLSPPQKMLITVEYFEDERCIFTKDFVGELLYVRPYSSINGWLLGFSFETPDQTAMGPVVRELQNLANQGLIERA